MSNMRRSKRLVALAAGLALVAVACGDDDDSTGTTAAPATTNATATTSGSETTTAGSTASTSAGATATTSAGAAPTGETAATLTIDLNPDAVWEDGSPITWADLQCTWQAALNTPGSIVTTGYDQITSVERGKDDKQAVVSLKSVYAPYKILFSDASAPIIKKAAVKDCNDISGDFSTEMPISGRPMKLDSWSESQSVFVPNDNYWGDDKPTVGQIVMVPQTDQDTEAASIKAGQVDYISPQFGDVLGTLQGDPNIKLDPQNGFDYEGIYFQQKDGPLADPDLRAALFMSIDRQALFDQIYGPIFTAADVEGKLNNCGSIVEGKWCPPDNFQNTYDPTAAEKLLTDKGWKKGGDGFWAKDGQAAPKIRWMINTGNTRRENTQAYLIPLLQQAGFNVVADNCDAACVFQQRQPTLDYDMAMYIQTPPPDPQFLTPLYTCDQIPSEENGNKGANTTGWCNQEVSDALHKADATLDEDARKELIFTAMRGLDTDHVMLPLVTFPRTGVWRTDQVGGDITKDTKNFTNFANRYLWEDLNKDGKIVIGAEQWPECLNPVTECTNSSWMVWTISFPLLPGVWDTTPDGEFVATNLVASEPEFKVL